MKENATHIRLTKKQKIFIAKTWAANSIVLIGYIIGHTFL